MSFYRGPKTVTNGLVLALDAADRNSYPRSGTTWRDVSGNSTNGTLTNGPLYSDSDNGIISFDGTNDYCDLGNSLATLTNLSIEVFIKFSTQSSNYNGIVSKTLDNTDGWEIRTTTYTSTTTNVEFRYKGDAAGSGGTTLNNSTWYQIVATGASGNQSLYINGIYNRNGTAATTPTANSNSLVLGKLAYAGLYANMTLGSVKIYDRALTAAEIAQNFNALRGRFGI